MEACKYIDETTKLKLPSACYVSRLRFALDAAYMCVIHNKLKAWMEESGIAVYPMIDSSPQGGRNNELSAATIIRKNELHFLWSLMLDMCARPMLSFFEIIKMHSMEDAY